MHQDRSNLFTTFNQGNFEEIAQLRGTIILAVSLRHYVYSLPATGLRYGWVESSHVLWNLA